MILNKVFIIIIIYLIKKTSLLLKFPFQYIKNITANYTQQLTESEIFTELKIGNPPQKILSKIAFDEFTFYIFNYKNDSSNIYYNNKNSNSFKIINNEEKQYEYFNGQIAEEKFYFTDIKNKEIFINNCSFIFTNKISLLSKKYPSGIGCIIRSKMKNEINFFHELKSKNIINNLTFSFFFSNINEGEFIIGNYPHDYNSSFDKNNFYYDKIRFNYMLDSSSVTFSELITYNQIYKEDYDLEFDINLYGIIVHYDYFQFIKKNFFDEYITINKCNIIMNERFNHFICDDDIDITKFQNLTFINKVMNMSFILDYNDLFFKYENKFIFLGFNDKSLPGIWKIGRIFMVKYQAIFDLDREIIGFYKNIKNPSNNYLKIIIFVILVCIIGILIFKSYKIVKKNRKVRANELEENFDYIPQNI